MSEATDGEWAELVVGGRDGCSAIYDPIRGRMLVFGGYDGSWHNDVWVLSLTGEPIWKRLVPTGTPPAARSYHSAIYDPARDRMVVFGGIAKSWGRLNDVWALSLGDAPEWTQLTPAGTPPAARSGQTAIYDPAGNRLVVFGGYNGSTTYFNDSWALALGDVPAWVRLAPTGPTPSARHEACAIHDPVRGRMVVFGGSGLNDTWTLSLAGTPAWTQLTPAGTLPGGRLGQSAVYDPVRDRMVVFGGTALGRFNDVWTLSLAGTPTWTVLLPDSTPPRARGGHGATYDPAGDRMVVFGGYPGSFANDTWELSLAGAPAWRELRPTDVPPSVRWGQSAIHDPVRDQMLVFGGYDASGLLNDLWTLSLTGVPAWTRLTPAGTPPSRRWGHTAIYDPPRDRMLMFGGHNNEVWALSLRDTAWARLMPAGTPPPARYCHTAIYDPVRDRMVVFGGYPVENVPNDTWALSLGGTLAWVKLSPTGTPPSARGGHAAIYDPVRDRMVMIGGHDNSGWLNDAWTLTLGTAPAWTPLWPSGIRPGPREAHGAVYDPGRDRVVVFGGYSSSAWYFGDAWTLTLGDEPAWNPLTGVGASACEREYLNAFYDPLRDRMFVFGGVNNGASRNDVWSLTWGAPALAGVTCPGDVVWMPGGGLAVSYSITNPYGFAQTADYTLSSARDWPGFPVSGSILVDANATVAVPVSVPTPDSAAGGRIPLSFRATLRGVPQYAACAHDLVDETTPVRLSLVSALVDPDRVRLTWLAAGGVGSGATVYRCVVPGAWDVVGRVTPDGSGQLVYEDRAVTPGARYGYRLGVMDQGREVFAGETWVEVPRTAVLALAGVHPNPATKALAVTFSLPDAAPARLEAFDLAGRRVAAREVGPLGVGSHEVPLGEGRALAPGVYLLRLTRGDRRLTTRAVIVR